MSLRSSAYLESMCPVSMELGRDVESEKHAHSFTDIILIPASPARATAVSTSEGEGQTTYVDALASDWSGFIHEY